ncbi:MAG: DUF417 family protein [Parcubacteria group bacterium]
MSKLSTRHLSAKHHDKLVTVLRLSLATVFMWFGALKVAGFNPVFDLIHHSMAPFLAYGTGFLVLGLFEVLIGFLLLTNRMLGPTHLFLFLHLLGTFSVLFFGWNVIFNPSFPVLSLQGEFVVKNIVLVSAGLVVLAHESKKAVRR